jgi:predicted lipoprotein with Yx(FWY)xxD motif
MISTTKGTDGAYLVGSSGRALYLWVADVGGKSVCSGACAKAWPPLTTTGTPTAGTGVNASDLGTVMRADGTKQVTYKGHPLYYFVKDKDDGDAYGQGSTAFGAGWYVLSPNGSKVDES